MWNVQPFLVKELTCNIYYRPQWSCEKVMFSLLSVILSTGGGGGYDWSQVPSRGGGGGYTRGEYTKGVGIPEGGYNRRWIYQRYAPWKVHPPVLTSSSGHRSGWHASYWKAYLWQCLTLKWQALSDLLPFILSVKNLWSSGLTCRKWVWAEHFRSWFP